MDTKYCEICKETKEFSKFTLNPDGSIRKHVCKSCYNRKWYAQLRLEMFEVFGWKCQCCGEDHPHFLTLDHILEDGASHRAEYKSSNTDLIYVDARREGWPKDKYQLLCMNCNFAKGHYGICPHKTGMKAEEVLENLKSKIFHTGKTLQNNKNNKGLAYGPKAQHERAIERGSTRVKLSPEESLQKVLKNLTPEMLAKLMANLKT